MARPEHLEAVKAVVGVFARDVVGTYLSGPRPQQLEAPRGAAAGQQQQQQPGVGLRCVRSAVWWQCWLGRVGTCSAGRDAGRTCTAAAAWR